MLSKRALLDLVLGAVRATKWKVVLLGTRHPYDLVFFRDERSLRARLYVWNVTHGGGSARAPSEYRIQITGVALPLGAPGSFQALLFGWYQPLQVIVAFDPERHRSPSAASPSIQITLETLERAAAAGLAVQRRANDEIAIAFRPELLMAYIEAQRSLHAFAGSQSDLDLLIQAGAGEAISDEQAARIPVERERVIRMVVTHRREATFRARILAAYGHRCATCHLQLDLVQAAHIVPVGVPGSTDETSNGLALCALHHEAYDAALVEVCEDYRVVISEGRTRALRAARRNGEEARFRRHLKPRLLLPAAAADRPRPDYLRKGRELRQSR